MKQRPDIASSNHILNKTSQKLLRKAIQNHRNKLDKINKELYFLFQELSTKHIHQIIWDTFDKLIEISVDSTSTIRKNRQLQKFSSLQSKQQNNIKTLNTVHNLTGIEIDKNIIDILQYGNNYAVTPKTIPLEDIITNVEAALHNVEQTKADEIKLDVINVLRKSKNPKPNISPKQLNTLNKLKKNENILVLPADKGNATVIVNTSDYHERMLNLINSPEYKMNKSDPTTYLEKKTKTIINSTTIPDDIKKTIIPREKSSRVPKIYGLPKIHRGHAGIMG
ncbi:hypothetical protein RI129_003164 [Pyrocoelia pectoralis]|uniref:Uncharacterized protein n=1 Tax=Pyrocoelia pectoralis TaxID=417401 RepID=A0AAN7ZML1_9COLE